MYCKIYFIILHKQSIFILIKTNSPMKKSVKKNSMPKRLMAIMGLNLLVIGYLILTLGAIIVGSFFAVIAGVSFIQFAIPPILLMLFSGVNIWGLASKKKWSRISEGIFALLLILTSAIGFLTNYLINSTIILIGSTTGPVIGIIGLYIAYEMFFDKITKNYLAK